MHTCSHACMHACTHARMDTCIAPLAVSSQRDRNLAERERPDVLILTFTRYPYPASDADPDPGLDPDFDTGLGHDHVSAMDVCRLSIGALAMLAAFFKAPEGLRSWCDVLIFILNVRELRHVNLSNGWG